MNVIIATSTVSVGLGDVWLAITLWLIVASGVALLTYNAIR